MTSTGLKPVASASTAPEHLSKRSRALWDEVERGYVLEATERELLRLGLEALDRCAQARETLDREGLVLENWYHRHVAHPCVAIERDSRIAAVRIFRELGLENAPDLDRSPVALARRRR